MIILTYISAFVMIFGGGYLALLGFKKINPKKDNPEHQEKMIKWHKKFGGFAKYGGSFLVIYGILNIAFPSLSPYTPINEKVSKEWTIEQKDKLAEQIINSSNYLKTINQDTAILVSKCIVDKYTSTYSLDDSWKHDKMSQEEAMQIWMPIMKDCFKQYGLKTIK